MLVSVVGTSTSFAYWAFGVAWHALEEHVGEVHHVHCTTISQMHAQWEKRAGRSVLFTTDYLEEKVSQLLLESHTRMVVVVDPAEVAIVTAAQYRPMSFLDAVRHTSMYIASLAEPLAQVSTVAFGSKSRAAQLQDFLPRFTRAMGLPDNTEFVEKVTRRIEADETSWSELTVDQAVRKTQPQVDVDEYVKAWTDRERHAFKQVAADYQQILDRQPARQLTWPAALLHSQKPDYSTDRPLDLIGPARPLIWGPYMHLPKGRWVASMEFEVFDNHSPNTVTAAILVGGEFYSQGDFDFPVKGIFFWKLSFEVDDISKPVEVRLTLKRSAIEGTVFLREARVLSLSDDD